MELAKREHVPARIAKGELQGKMKCRIWRKLHAEEAKRFDQVYALMGQHPGLEFTDAFGVVHSGLGVEEFLGRKARAQKKTALKDARGAVSASPVNELVDGLIRDKVELCVVLAEKTLLDVLTGVEPVAFTFEKQGRIAKLRVVLLARRSEWERIAPTVELDQRFAQEPLPVAAEPEQRPVSDPRPFLEHMGKALKLTLRNGVKLTRALKKLGPFDLIVGDEKEELLIPLHAIARWEP